MPPALPPPPSAGLRSRRPKKPGRLNISLSPATASPAERSATNAGSTVANQKSSTSKNASSYRRAQTLDPELLRTDNGGNGEEGASTWVSFGSASRSSSAGAATSTEQRDDAAAAAAAAGAGGKGSAMPRITTTMDASSTTNNTSLASSPSFLTTTDQSFDVTPPIHRSFLADAGRRSAGNGASNSNPFGIPSNNNIEESPPVTFIDNAFAEAAFTLDGSEDVEVSRFDISVGPNIISKDDAIRDAAPEPAPAAATTTSTSTSTSSSSSRAAASSSASHRPDWSDVATWMRAPIDAITDAVVTPVLPPRFDANSGPTSNSTNTSSGSAAAGTGADAVSPIPPPRQRGGGGVSGNAGTPTIRPPRPSGTRATAVASGTSPSIASSSQPSTNEGGVSSPSPSSGTGAAERRRSAARKASAQSANTSPILSPRRLGLGRSASNVSSSSPSGTGTATQEGTTRSPIRNSLTNASSSTPRSTPTRGRSSSRVRSSTLSKRGRSSSRTRGSAPTTPSSVSRSRRSRSVSRGGTPGSDGRGRSVSRTRDSPRSSRRTPSSRMARGVPSSPSAQSTRRGRNSGRQNRGRARSVSRTRRAPPESPSANSTGGLARRRYANGGNDGWNIDLDDVSITSEPVANASSRSGRSRNLSRNGSGALNASNLRSLDLEGGGNGKRAGTRSGSIDSSSISGATSSTNGATASSSKKNKSFRQEGGLIEKLFGDTVSNEARRAYLPSRNQSQTLISSNHSVASGQSAAAQPEAVHTRTLLTASVYHNQATGLWIATINTNQKPGATNRRNAAKYLKAFSFHTEREARESAYANAPPKMVPFTESPNCFICRGKFAVFRRPSHCRNCGVCICSSCTATWSSKMIPETYNMKKESSVKVCKSCNFLVLAFRRALLDGQYDEAIALYNTGNINLRCPFGNVKNNEAMYPIHCAAEGGNLDLLRWLVDVHFCPISLVRTGNKKPDKENTNTPIVTSKGRSILNIAMSKQNVEMMRYLVSEKNVSVYEIKDLSTSLKALEAVLTSYPSDNFIDFDLNGEGPINFDLADNLDILDGDGDEFDDDSILSDGDLRSVSGPANTTLPSSDQKEMDAMSTAAADACIICYDNSIDCVMTPCGHQICCLKCSAELANTCPVCNSQGQFIRIFKP